MISYMNLQHPEMVHKTKTYTHKKKTIKKKKKNQKYKQTRGFKQLKKIQNQPTMITDERNHPKPASWGFCAGLCPTQYHTNSLLEPESRCTAQNTLFGLGEKSAINTSRQLHLSKKKKRSENPSCVCSYHNTLNREPPAICNKKFLPKQNKKIYKAFLLKHFCTHSKVLANYTFTTSGIYLLF